MVKQPTSESTEFQIHSEDFPALPGSQGIFPPFSLSFFFFWNSVLYQFIIENLYSSGFYEQRVFK